MKGPFPVVFAASPQGGDRPPSEGFPKQQLGDMLSLSLCYASSIRDLFRFPAAILLTAWYKKRKKDRSTVTRNNGLTIWNVSIKTMNCIEWKTTRILKLYDDMYVLYYYRTRTLSMMTSPSMATALTTSAIILKSWGYNSIIHCFIMYIIRCRTHI